MHWAHWRVQQAQWSLGTSTLGLLLHALGALGAEACSGQGFGQGRGAGGCTCALARVAPARRTLINALGLSLGKKSPSWASGRTGVEGFAGTERFGSTGPASISTDKPHRAQLQLGVCNTGPWGALRSPCRLCTHAGAGSPPAHAAPRLCGSSHKGSFCFISPLP